MQVVCDVRLCWRVSVKTAEWRLLGSVVMWVVCDAGLQGEGDVDAGGSGDGGALCYLGDGWCKT